MKTVLVAEIGINHNGDEENIKQLIDIAILGGCQYVKFQKRTIEEVYSEEELNTYRESPWGNTNRQQKIGLELQKEQYDNIDKYCKEKNIGWFASPWDKKSVDFLMQYNPEYIKVASALVTNIELLEHIKSSISGTSTKIILACGMTTKEELDSAIDVLGKDTIDYILSCTSSYPTPIKDMNMKRIETLKKEYGENFKIGFSNHSSGIAFILMSYCLGAEMIEYHVTLDRTMYGSDQASSIEAPGAIKIRKYLTSYEDSWGDGILGCTQSEVEVKKKLRKV